MGQVISVDFSQRTKRAPRPSDVRAEPETPPALTFGRPAPIVAPAPDTAVAAPNVGPVAQPAVAPAAPAATSTPGSLAEVCARMRAETDALQAAMAELKRATADLHRLPALARELCAAAL
jgi:hypothetical protein